MKKLVTVFGATGQQGGSVLRALAADPGYSVRAVTRDPTSSRAAALQKLGVEVVKADLDDQEAVSAALKGAYGCFLVTDFWATMDVEKEITQGKNAADAAKEAGVEHLVFSSQERVKGKIGKEAPQCDGKADIEDYIKAQNIPCTVVRLSGFYENFYRELGRKTPTGEIVVAMPMGNVPMTMVNTGEMGEVVRSILNHRDQYLGQGIGLAGDILTVDQMIAVLAKVFAPTKFINAHMSPEAYAMFPFPGAAFLAAMFEFYQKGFPHFDLALTRKLNPEMPTFEQWVVKNKEGLMKVIDSATVG